METNKELYDVYEFKGDGEPCELIEAPDNIELNEHGYKLMGYLYKDKEKPLIFDGKRMVVMTKNQFADFEKEKKIK